MKKKKLRKGIFIGALGVLPVIFLVIGILFLFKPDMVYAVQSIAHVGMILFRVDTEILKPTPHGRYYSDMYWKHNAELIQIFNARPENYNEVFHVALLYVDHLEALVEGRGDEVHISQKQVDSLENKLNWIKSEAGEKLGEDIEWESARTPLDDFVGLTMNEALDYIERAWLRDFPTPPTPVPTLQPTGSPVP